MSLTKRQALFVDAYLIEPNGTKAAVIAGYSRHGAEVTASKLLRHKDVAAELTKRRKSLSVKSGITPELVMMELAKLGFSDITSIVQWSGDEVTIRDSALLGAGAASAISEVSQSKDGMLKIKMHDKLGALVRIGQQLGMFRAPTTDEVGKKAQVADAARKVEKTSVWGDDLATSCRTH